MNNLLMNAEEMNRAITRIAHEILEKNKGTRDLALVGIRTRGVLLASRLREKIKDIEKVTLDMGILDITLYRDDLGTGKDKPVLRDTDIPFAIDGKKVVLCDDVLFTGRTIRAAIDALVDFGRPAQVQLAVLIDRGHRELPIRPDFVGKNIPTSKSMTVKVHMTGEDPEDQVIVIDNKK